MAPVYDRPSKTPTGPSKRLQRSHRQALAPTQTLPQTLPPAPTPTPAPTRTPTIQPLRPARPGAVQRAPLLLPALNTSKARATKPPPKQTVLAKHVSAKPALATQDTPARPMPAPFRPHVQPRPVPVPARNIFATVKKRVPLPPVRAVLKKSFRASAWKHAAWKPALLALQALQEVPRWQAASLDGHDLALRISAPGHARPGEPDPAAELEIQFALVTAREVGLAATKDRLQTLAANTEASRAVVLFVAENSDTSDVLSAYEQLRDELQDTRLSIVPVGSADGVVLAVAAFCKGATAPVQLAWPEDTEFVRRLERDTGPDDPVRRRVSGLLDTLDGPTDEQVLRSFQSR